MKFLLIFAAATACLTAAAQPVEGGSDVLANAIQRIVPRPYTASIDERIPASTVVTWPASSDWMRAVHSAAVSAGLKIQPQWAEGRLNFTPDPLAKKAAPQALQDVAVDFKKSAPPPAGQASKASPAAGAGAERSVVPVVVEPAAANPSAVPAAAPAFVLMPGKRVDLQFAEWAKQGGWQVIWSSPKSWVVPGVDGVSYPGPVDVAIESAIRDLFANGIPVRLEIWEANKVVEITHAK